MSEGAREGKCTAAALRRENFCANFFSFLLFSCARSSFARNDGNGGVGGGNHHDSQHAPRANLTPREGERGREREGEN